MKRIKKTHAPSALTRWIDENAGLNCRYEDLIGTNAHRALKDQLLKEQGYLCAYTGKRISDEKSHVEHLKPQRLCRNREDVDYRNMAACFPANGGDVSYGYGAPVKGDWWDEDLFVSPLKRECEQRFAFTWSGHIKPQPEGHEAAEKTIKVLGLDHTNLCKLRQSRINGFFGFGGKSKSKQLSKSDAVRLLDKIDQPDGNGQFQEFCFVLKQLLPKYTGA